MIKWHSVISKTANLCRFLVMENTILNLLADRGPGDGPKSDDSYLGAGDFLKLNSKGKLCKLNLRHPSMSIF